MVLRFLILLPRPIAPTIKVWVFILYSFIDFCRLYVILKSLTKGLIINEGKTIEFVSKVYGDSCDYWVSNKNDDYSLCDLYDPQEYWEGTERRIDNATVEIV